MQDDTSQRFLSFSCSVWRTVSSILKRQQIPCSSVVESAAEHRRQMMSSWNINLHWQKIAPVDV
jgi:hypothetical protein